MPDQFLHSTYTVHIGRRHVEMAANRVKESLPSLPPNNFLLVSQDSSVIQVWLARLANDQKAKTSAVRHNEQEGRYSYMWNSVVWPLRNIILVQKAIFLRGMPSEPPSCCKLRHALVTKCNGYDIYQDSSYAQITPIWVLFKHSTLMQYPCALCL